LLSTAATLFVLVIRSSPEAKAETRRNEGHMEVKNIA
jgi:hypothetical protein